MNKRLRSISYTLAAAAVITGAFIGKEHRTEPPAVSEVVANPEAYERSWGIKNPARDMERALKALEEVEDGVTIEEVMDGAIGQIAGRYRPHTPHSEALNHERGRIREAVDTKRRLRENIENLQHHEYANEDSRTSLEHVLTQVDTITIQPNQETFSTHLGPQAAFIYIDAVIEREKNARELVADINQNSHVGGYAKGAGGGLLAALGILSAGALIGRHQYKKNWLANAQGQ